MVFTTLVHVLAAFLAISRQITVSNAQHHCCRQLPRVHAVGDQVELVINHSVNSELIVKAGELGIVDGRADVDPRSRIKVRFGNRYVNALPGQLQRAKRPIMCNFNGLCIFAELKTQGKSARTKLIKSWWRERLTMLVLLVLALLVLVLLVLALMLQPFRRVITEAVRTPSGMAAELTIPDREVSVSFPSGLTEYTFDDDHGRWHEVISNAMLVPGFAIGQAIVDRYKVGHQVVSQITATFGNKGSIATGDVGIAVGPSEQDAQGRMRTTFPTMEGWLDVALSEVSLLGERVAVSSAEHPSGVQTAMQADMLTPFEVGQSVFCAMGKYCGQIVMNIVNREEAVQTIQIGVSVEAFKLGTVIGSGASKGTHVLCKFGDTLVARRPGELQSREGIRTGLCIMCRHGLKTSVQHSILKFLITWDEGALRFPRLREQQLSETTPCNKDLTPFLHKMPDTNAMEVEVTQEVEWNSESAAIRDEAMAALAVQLQSDEDWANCVSKRIQECGRLNGISDESSSAGGLPSVSDYESSAAYDNSTVEVQQPPEKSQSPMPSNKVHILKLRSGRDKPFRDMIEQGCEFKPLRQRLSSWNLPLHLRETGTFMLVYPEMYNEVLQSLQSKGLLTKLTHYNVIIAESDEYLLDEILARMKCKDRPFVSARQEPDDWMLDQKIKDFAMLPAVSEIFEEKRTFLCEPRAVLKDARTVAQSTTEAVRSSSASDGNYFAHRRGTNARRVDASDTLP